MKKAVAAIVRQLDHIMKGEYCWLEFVVSVLSGIVGSLLGLKMFGVI